jgi:hypothetical protein
MQTYIRKQLNALRRKKEETNEEAQAESSKSINEMMDKVTAHFNANKDRLTRTLFPDDEEITAHIDYVKQQSTKGTLIL